MDELIAAIDETQSPIVVGLDPTQVLIPQVVIREFMEEARGEVDDPEEQVSTGLSAAYFEFNRAIIDAIVGIAPAVKPQIAMYEALGPAGIDAYTMTCQYAQDQGLYVIGDVKRGDIGSTASAYAAHLSGVTYQEQRFDAWHENSITINPYLGSDGIEPFLKSAAEHNASLFALVRTSNPSSSQIQELKLADGRALYQQVAQLVEQWGEPYRGEYGYSRLGAVVGATHAQQLRELREAMPHTFFLVPGYGAQGGSARDVAGAFDKDGRGAIINSSRGIIGAWRQQSTDFANADEALDAVAQAARDAAIDMRDSIRAVLP